MEIVHRQGQESPVPEKQSPAPAAPKLHKNKQYVRMLALEHIRKHNLKFNTDGKS